MAMKSLLSVLLLTTAWLTALGQGTVNFQNRITGVVDAPVFDTDGTTRLSGTGFRAALFAAPNGSPDSALAQVGDSVAFRTGAAAGYVDGSGGLTRTLPGVPEGGAARIQIRAWDATKGSTYAAAFAAGGKTGSSPVITVTTGGGLTPPQPLLGLSSFKLQISSPPIIVTAPSPVTTGLGGTASFTVVAGGPGPFTYQWSRNGSPIGGATSATLTIASVASGNAGNYSVRIDNPFGFTNSLPVALTIAPLPTIAAVTVSPNPPLVGRALRMEVVVTGTGPFSYQWQINNADLPGATGSILERGSAEAGTFAVKVTGPGGTVRREVATVLAQYVLTVASVRGGTVDVSPAQASYASGSRVTLTPRADSGYEFGGWAGDVVSLETPLVLVMDAHKTITPAFRPTGGTVNFVNRITGTLDAPVFDADGVTKVDSNYAAALYAGASPSTLVQVGAAVAFRSGAAAGYIAAEERVIPDVRAGGLAYVQMRAWSAAHGATYEAALAAGGKTGTSPVFTVITGNVGSPPSLPAVLTGLTSFRVQSATPPLITSQPRSVVTGIGGTARFEVVASGSPPLSYAWRKGTSPISGASASVFEIPVVAATDAGSYSVVVSNPHGARESDAATLTIAPLPSITSVNVSPNPPQFGRALRLEVVVGGTGPFTYQWYRGDNPVTGATGAVLNLDAAEPGTYSVRVTGPGGTTRRDVATVVAQYTLTLQGARGGSIAATPEQETYASGSTVQLSVRTEPGYEFSGWTGDLSGTAHPASLVMDGHKTVGALFRSSAGTLNFVNRITGALDAPVFDIDGTTRLDGRYLAALYAGTVSNALVQIGAAVPFRSDAGIGYISGEERVAPMVAGGQPVFVQMRAWRASDGASYEAAAAAGGKIGESSVIVVVTGNAGSPPTPPTAPLALQSFRLRQGAPPVIASTTATPTPAIPGRALRLEVVASGPGPLTYAWFLGTAPINGANAATLEVAAAALGTYAVQVTGPGGSVRQNVITVVEGFVLTLEATHGGTLVATPDRASYTAGTSVSLAAVAEPGYEFAEWYGDLTGSLTPATVVMNAHKSIGARFRSTGGTVLFVNRITGTLDAPVYDVDGVTLLDSAFVAQLYAGTSPGALAAVGAPVAFRDGAGAGYFPVEERSIPGIAPGQTVQAQVRAWRLADGATYEAAVAANRAVGASDVLTVVTGNVGSPPSLPAVLVGLRTFKLQVGAPPTISRHPAPVALLPGGTARFDVAATGLAPLTYQWFKGTTAIPDATAPSLELRGVTDADVADYSVRVRNALGFADSSAARLTLLVPTAITRFVVTGTPVAGRPLKLEAIAAGSPPLAYEWFRDTTPIAGAIGPVLDLPSAAVGVYSVRVSGPGGVASGTAATVTVQYALTLVPGRGGRIVATPPGPAYDPGTSVSLRPEADPGYTFTGWGGALSGITVPAVLRMNDHWTVSASFRPTNGTVNLANRVTGIVDAPVFDLDGRTPLEGAAFLAQLYAGPAADRLGPVGAPVPFRTGLAAGFVVAEERSIPTVPPGGRAFAQLRAWEAVSGDTFENAASTGGKVGISPTIEILTGNAGSPPTPPGYLTGLASFHLELGRKPEIVTAPIATVTTNGQPATLRVVATGTPAPQYQWIRNGVDLIGATSSTLAFAPARPTDTGLYAVRVFNALGEVTTPPVQLDVLDPPAIVALPVPAPVLVGDPVSLAVTATGSTPLHYQWYQGPAGDISKPLGTDAPSLVAGPMLGSASFWVRVRNAVGSADSSAVLVTVNRRPQTIAFGTPSPTTFGAGPTALQATASSGLPVVFSIVSGPGTVAGSSVTPTGAGEIRIRASQPGDATYLPAPEVERTLTVSRGAQSITFNPPSPVLFGTGPVALAATASSGLPVSFERVSGPATLSGNALTLTGAGNVVVRASQAGNANYAPAPAVERTLVVNKATATVTLGRLEQPFDGTRREVSVTVDPPGLPTRITYDGSPLAPTAEGTYAVVATVDDANYAGSASGTLRVTAVINLAGAVFDDLDADGTQGASEAGLADVTLRLLALDGTTELRTVITDADGRFALKGVAAGSYYLNEQNPSGYVSTTPDLRLVTVGGDAPTEVNFGDQRVGTVTGVVFEDLDGDGTLDDAERGLAGVAVRLSGAGSTRTAATAADGRYRFDGVAPGTYTVEETDPAGFGSTTPNLRSVSVSPGGAATANFGDQPVGTIGGVVFVDLNGNGLQDLGEAGLAGATVRLGGNGFNRTETSRADGTYLFTGLTAGIYTVEETDPVGYASTTPNTRLLSISGAGATANFGDQPVGTVAGRVFEDRNGNGAEDTGEPGIAGVHLRLASATGQVTGTTDASGNFRFADVVPGAYSLEETDPIGFVSTTPNQRTVHLAPGGSVGVVFGDQPAGTVSGIVFHDLDGNGARDSGEPGIGGVSVRLFDAAGQRTTVTSGDGSYQFAFVSPGSYTVEETDPLGYGSTTPNVRNVSVAAGGSANASFGDQAAGTVAGSVFEDTNGDGSRDPGEAGIGGVTVRLTGTAGQRTTTTSGDGSYQFPGTAPGTYTVEEFDPVGFTSTTPNVRTVNLAAGGTAGASFGDQASGTVGGVVYEDVNGNGLQEAGEPGLGGVSIRLLATVGQVSTVTGGDGTYRFTSVIPGSYTVEETDPAGYSSTTPNLRSIVLASGSSATASFGDQASGTLAGLVFSDTNGNGLRDEGESGIGGVTLRATGATGTRTTFTGGDGTYQFAALVPGAYTVEETDPSGFASTTPNLRAVSLASGGSASASFGDQPIQTISGVVFEDTNGNGRSDAGEPGIGGVSLDLLPAGSEDPIRSTVTSADGRYAFAEVPAGSYSVRQTIPSSYTVLAVNGLPPGPALQGGAPAPTTVVKAVSLADGGAANANFGNNVAGSLSGMVYLDLDGNGSPSPGEPGLGGATVQVRRVDGGAMVASAVTTGSGVYTIPAVPAGAYRITQVALAGYFVPVQEVRVTLDEGGAAIANFGNLAGGTVSGRVFNDENGDGSVGPSEPGLGGVRVVLRAAGALLAETVTAGDGAFLFTGVTPGTLAVEHTVPSGFRAITPATAERTLASGGAVAVAFADQSESVRPPAFSAEPADLVLADGASGELVATATGTDPLEFQWLKDGTPVPNATNATLRLAPARLADAGLYHLRVRNPIGTTLSRAARLTVTTGDPFAAWASGYALASGPNLATQDPDLDGLSNLFEFFLGTNPTNATTAGLPFPVEVAANGQRHVGFELSRARAATSVRIALQASDDLARWSEVASDITLVRSGAETDVLWITDRSPTSEHPHRFLRLALNPTALEARPARLSVVSAPPLTAFFRISVDGQAGVVYTLERTSDFKTWTFVQTVTGAAAPVTVIDDNVGGSAHWFYRAVIR